MQRRNSLSNVTVVSMFLVVSSPSAFAGFGHGEDTVIGHNAAGQLAVFVNSPGPNVLPPVDSLIHGWAADEPGNKTPDADNPANDFFTLAPGAIIHLELVSIDPALKVWSPGFLNALTAPGNSFLLGGSDFDTHGTYHIDSTDPNFDPDQHVWAATLRVVDTGTTNYSASAPFTISFTVPEPASLTLFGLIAVGVVAKQRSWRVCSRRTWSC